MKKMIFAAVTLAVVGMSAQTVRAGDREWATVGKVLTGVAAGAVIARAVDGPAYVSASYGYGPGYSVTVATPAPCPPPVPVVYAPAPVCYAPAPVVYCAPRPVYYAPAPVYVSYGHYGHSYGHGHYYRGCR
jgi:hypothetical protein